MTQFLLFISWCFECVSAFAYLLECAEIKRFASRFVLPSQSVMLIKYDLFFAIRSNSTASDPLLIYQFLKIDWIWCRIAVGDRFHTVLLFAKHTIPCKGVIA
jgi:hypothetical protein